MSDEKCNFIRAVTRPHAEFELHFYRGVTEKVLELASIKPLIQVAEATPKLSKKGEFCFFKGAFPQYFLSHPVAARSRKR